jgi:Carbamoyltransferase N-terminus
MDGVGEWATTSVAIGRGSEQLRHGPHHDIAEVPRPVRGPPRSGEMQLAQRHVDLAASAQKVTEEIVLRITRDLAKTYAVPNLCLAGGVALNCVTNGKLLRDGRFEPCTADARSTRNRRIPRRDDCAVRGCCAPGPARADRCPEKAQHRRRARRLHFRRGLRRSPRIFRLQA